ncbi:MAG: hypothetical protein IT503_02015 [Burkholderiaceae bacterium]|nr:hypothetical protein [Burkholderiaceae bacterium]
MPMIDGYSGPGAGPCASALCAATRQPAAAATPKMRTGVLGIAALLLVARSNGFTAKPAATIAPGADDVPLGSTIARKNDGPAGGIALADRAAARVSQVNVLSHRAPSAAPELNDSFN